jgi:hypothetical protein
MKRPVLLILTVLIVLTALTATTNAWPVADRSWRVTIANLTPPGSQPLSPPLLVVHSHRVDVWSVGHIATHPLAAIAEDANNAPAESALAALAGVRSVGTGAGGPIPPGVSASYEVMTHGPFDRLSLVTMLVNTNDAFTGLDSLRLRGQGHTHEVMAYDAGSEVNNQLRSHIPGPCCMHSFVRDPEGALIAPHPGILAGVGELDPATYAWSGAAARITITRQ